MGKWEWPNVIKTQADGDGMGYDPFIVLNRFVDTLMRFKLWKVVDVEIGQEFARKHADYSKAR